MAKNYLLSLCASAFALFFMAACGNNNNDVDWDKPLCDLDAKGDTMMRYEYRNDGKLIADYEETSSRTYEYDGKGNLVTTSYYYYGNLSGSEVRKYDDQNRIIAYECEVESDVSSSSFTYEGNKRIETSEEGLSEVVYKNVTETYYDENGNDTLIICRSARVREHSDTECDYSVEPVVYQTRKTYVTINGEAKLKSSVKKEVRENDCAILREQEDYEYDGLGRVISYNHYDDFGYGCPVSNEKFTYQYSDNCRTDQDGNKTYYKRK